MFFLLLKTNNTTQHTMLKLSELTIYELTTEKQLLLINSNVNIKSLAPNNVMHVRGIGRYPYQDLLIPGTGYLIIA